MPYNKEAFDELVIALENTKFMFNSLFVKALQKYELTKMEKQLIKSYKEQLIEALKKAK